MLYKYLIILKNLNRVQTLNFSTQHKKNNSRLKIKKTILSSNTKLNYKTNIEKHTH